jgi:hypothetical protein
MLFAEMGLPTTILLVVIVATTSFLLMRGSRYLSRSKSPEPSWSSIARKPKESPGRGADIPPEMASWEVEMHEFVREIKGELDSKMLALQAVTAEADRAAARLEAAIGNSPNAAFSREGDAPAAPNKSTPVFNASTARQEPRPAELAKSILQFREDAGKGKPGIDLGNLPSSQAESLSPAGVPHAEHSSAQSKKEEIYMFADYGMQPSEIAARVGHHIGEVELILSLRGKK